MFGRDLTSELAASPYFGNQFWGLTDACVQHALAVADGSEDYCRAYASVYAPDEHFFHTIVGNSEFQPNAIPMPDRGAATNLHAPLHAVATNGERYFTAADSIEALASSGRFFLRKVSTGRSAALLDRIDAELLTSTSSQ